MQWFEYRAEEPRTPKIFLPRRKKEPSRGMSHEVAGAFAEGLVFTLDSLRSVQMPRRLGSSNDLMARGNAPRHAALLWTARQESPRPSSTRSLSPSRESSSRASSPERQPIGHTISYQSSREEVDTLANLAKWKCTLTVEDSEGEETDTSSRTYSNRPCLTARRSRAQHSPSLSSTPSLSTPVSMPPILISPASAWVPHPHRRVALLRNSTFP
ncbi:hypothetical protein T484DRAFT_1967037 [Baffinella frigidus]|nr:hypothetical protein T484DRAFT_1967037 [Cryptophyta sp. CCMP2293]